VRLAFMNFWIRFMVLFIPAYFVLGVIYPTKMAYINNITMSYVYIVGYTILTGLLNAALAVRSFLGI
jgi:hypothetical protein